MSRRSDMHVRVDRTGQNDFSFCVDDVAPDDFTIATMPARYAELGDLNAEIDDVAYRLDTLLDWAERDDLPDDEPAVA